MTIALVTGAARGIGLEVARQLAANGVDVVLSARSRERAQEAASALAAESIIVRPAVLDVTDEGSIRALVDGLGALDVLVNNAAAFTDWTELASSSDLRTARDVFEANLFGPWHLTQAALPLLRASRHARIVNVASGAGSHGDDQFGLGATGGRAASYGVSKAALLALTASLAAELDGSGILVNAVDPGLTATYPGAEDMGARPVAEGAAGVVWAATLPDDGPTGGFFRDGRPHPW
jgi:NAD(P)-dependent dehydrogenase (short-subunit alcohol dehydrogenase family)